ncbi:MAG: hypothetical protein JXR07_02375 [Reichenbachiella sp.]
MNNIDFWSEWEAPDRLIFKILSTSLLLLVITVLIFQLGDVSYFFDWEITAQLQEVLYPIHSNHSALLESTINTEISLILQKVTGGYRLLAPWMIYLFLVILYTAVMGILTMVSYTSRFWFIACMGLLILVVAGSGVGRLGLLGLEDKVVIGANSALFIFPAYYFNSVNKSVSKRIRFVTFMSLMLLSTGAIIITASVEAPLLQMAYHSYWPALVLSVIFILLIGHEIVYSILALTTEGVSQNESGNARHFIVFSFVYLLNVALVYFKNTGYLDWDIYYINPFLLLSVSAVLGVWGLKGREVLYGKTLPFHPYAIVIYLSLGIVCLTSIVFYSISGNDSTIEALEDMIVFGHLSFGGMFFIYIIINFINLLMKNLPIHRIAFKEDNFPYATSRLAGLIAVAALFFASDYASLSQSVSGYFNGMGDLNLQLERKEAAQAYYGYGSTYGNVLASSNGNHKSNYMLAVLETDVERIIPKMNNAIRRRSSEYAYASLGSAYEDDNRFFDALFTYQKGLKKFPASWALKNNLALLYNKTNVVDSILFYLSDTDDNSWHGTLTSANLLAVSTMRNLSFDLEQMNASDRLGFQNNRLGNAISTGNTAGLLDPTPLKSTFLHLYSYSYLKNLGIACSKNGDKIFLQIVDQFIANPRNGDYHNELKFIKGLNYYRQGQLSQAFELMRILEAENEDNGMINGLMGKWSMELGATLQASKYFEKSRESGYPWASTDLSQMYSLLGEKSMGQFLLNKEILKLDSGRLDVKERLVELEKAVKDSSIRWESIYSFEKEKIDLENLLRIGEGVNKKTIAVDFELLGLQNPFFEEGVIASANFFNKVQKDDDTAYSILLNAISINEYSAPLIQAYIDQCFSMGLLSYAEGSIMRLYDVLSLEEFQAYEQVFEQKKSAAQAKLDTWE